jgi:transcriptional regulator NrdR
VLDALAQSRPMTEGAAGRGRAVKERVKALTDRFPIYSKVSSRDALPELQQPRYPGEGFASDRGFGGDPAPPRLPACNFRFTTFERVQLRELTVIKRNGRRVPFDRDKLVRSLQIACASARSIRSGSRRWCPRSCASWKAAARRSSSEAIGEIVMEHLRQLDDVAYVRFASVYRNFREAKDFEAVLGELSGDDGARPPRYANDLPHSGRPVRAAPAVTQSEKAADDARFMALALALGRRGLGRTWPNPAVGAVVVKDGVIVGRGWTQPGGRPHAEVEALKQAGEAAQGATLYATLEPCSHVGKSPPCADAIIAAGIARVVSAIEDPNPEVAGQGHARLRAAGITVDVGLCADEAARDHAGHFRASATAAPCDPQARGLGRRQDRRRRPQAGPGDLGRSGAERSPVRGCICCARNATPSWSGSAPCGRTIRC